MTIVRFPVTLRTEEIVVGLNDARPGFMFAYPSVFYVLAHETQRDGGLLADFGYAPAFSPAMDSARELVRAGRDAEAFEVILGALPSWRPLSPLHLARWDSPGTATLGGS